MLMLVLTLCSYSMFWFFTCYGCYTAKWKAYWFDTHRASYANHGWLWIPTISPQRTN